MVNIPVYPDTQNCVSAFTHGFSVGCVSAAGGSRGADGRERPTELPNTFGTHLSVVADERSFMSESHTVGRGEKG